MNIYNPYFYIIQDTRNGMYYAGSKTSKGANPENFMIMGGYTTSSTVVNDIISKYGINIFLIRKIKIFKSKKDAYTYETRFLKRINAKINHSFYNKHNNDHIFVYHDDRYKEKMIDIYGVADPNKSAVIRQRIIDSNLLKFGVPYPTMSDTVKSERKELCLQKYGVDNVLHLQQVQEKIKRTNLQLYGTENVFASDAIKIKIKETLQKKYDVVNPMQSIEIKEKAKLTNLNRYGVENAFASEEIKIKIKEIFKLRCSRPTVERLKLYQRTYRLKLGSGWVKKSDEKLNTILNELIF